MIESKKNRVSEISFITDGCISSKACGSITTIFAKGKTLLEILKLVPQDIVSALNGLPEEKRHCSLLAIITLHEACKILSH